MKCRICNQRIQLLFNHLILNKYFIDYYYCKSCQFIQTESPYWLQEAYKNPIASIDTGIVKRNNLFAKRTSVILYFLFDKDSICLDYGGGNGLFVRMMRDIGFDFYWEDKFSDNLLSKGFSKPDNINEFKLITSFECFEHFVDPIEEIFSLMKKTDSILFSTQLFKDGPPKPEDWWYYNFEAGQHISLYSLQTLKVLANKFNLNLNSDNRGFHLLSKKKINNTIFNLLLKFSLLGLANFVKLVMESKTNIDMNYLKKLSNGENI